MAGHCETYSLPDGLDGPDSVLTSSLYLGDCLTVEDLAQEFLSVATKQLGRFTLELLFGDLCAAHCQILRYSTAKNLMAYFI
jgi:hypothetical protein